MFCALKCNGAWCSVSLPCVHKRHGMLAGPQWRTTETMVAASGKTPSPRSMGGPLPVAPRRCGAQSHGCGAVVDAYGDHRAACPRTGLLARRAKPLEHAMARVARGAVGPGGPSRPATVVGKDQRSRRRRIRSASASTLARMGPARSVRPSAATSAWFLPSRARVGPSLPPPRHATRDGAMPADRRTAQACGLSRAVAPGPQRLCILACEAGGRWNTESFRLVTQFARPRSQRAPAALRGRAGVAAPVVVSLGRGFAEHTCCHAAGDAGCCWRHARCAAARAGGRAARRGPTYTQPLGLVGCSLHWDPDPSLAVAKKRVAKKNLASACQNPGATIQPGHVLTSTACDSILKTLCLFAMAAPSHSRVSHHVGAQNQPRRVKAWDSRSFFAIVKMGAEGKSVDIGDLINISFQCASSCCIAHGYQQQETKSQGLGVPGISFQQTSCIMHGCQRTQIYCTTTGTSNKLQHLPYLRTARRGSPKSCWSWHCYYCQ